MSVINLSVNLFILPGGLAACAEGWLWYGAAAWSGIRLLQSCIYAPALGTCLGYAAAVPAPDFFTLVLPLTCWPDFFTWLQTHLVCAKIRTLPRKRSGIQNKKKPNLQTSYILELQRGLTVCTWAQLWMDPTSLRVMDQSLCVLHLREPYRETLCRHTQLSLLKCTWTVHGKCFGNENCKNKQTNKGKARQVTLQRSEGKSLLVPLPLERHFMRTSFGERRKGRTADPYCKVKLWLPNLWL